MNTARDRVLSTFVPLSILGMCAGPILATSAAASCIEPPVAMVSWWAGDGNTDDGVGSSNGTLMEGACFAPGKVGLALNFDGDKAYLDVGSATGLDNIFNGGGTVDAWFNAREVVSEGIGSFLVTKRNWALSVGDGRIFFLRAFPQSTPIWMTPTSSIDLNEWFHVAVTYDDSSTANVPSVYINGALQSISLLDPDDPPAGVAVDDSTSALHIGNRNYGPNGGSFDRGLDGLIDEVEIFGRILSGAEIQSIFDADTAGKCKRTVDHFQCYRAETAPGTPPFAPVPDVSLEDVYGLRTATVGTPKEYCVPVDKNGEGILHPTALLICHTVRRHRPRFEGAPEMGEHQFGSLTLDLTRSRRVCIPAREVK